MISRSVAQIATASMRTSTSAFFGTGTGFSPMLSWPGSPSTQAFMLSGIGNSLWLVFTPGGAYIFPPTQSLVLRSIRGGFMRGPRIGFTVFGGQRARRGGDLVAHKGDVLLGRAHRRRRGADRADDGTGLIADGGADADHARKKLFAVERDAVAAHDAQGF